MQELTFEQVEVVSGGFATTLSSPLGGQTGPFVANNFQSVTGDNDGGLREVNVGEKVVCLVLEGAAGGYGGHLVGKAIEKFFGVAITSGMQAAAVGGGVNVAAGGFGWCEKLLSTKAEYDNMMIAP